tara:strand:- start:10701 stop:11462 length:762 start_codon:yes stop_codon:yes gene_type:complete
MDWFNVLKMPNPFGGKWKDLTRSEYYRMDDKNKRRYHAQRHTFYSRQIKQAVTPRKAGQAPPATDDQIRGLRELQRFHSRQEQRLQHKRNKENYFSLEEEQNRHMIKPQYDAVEKIPHTTKEMYDNYTREDKKRYWKRLANHLREEYGNEHPKVKWASTTYSRMRSYSNYTPPFEGDELSKVKFYDKYLHPDVSEYVNFTNEEKEKYHNRMRQRNLKSNLELSRWHSKMQHRLLRNLNLPTYPTPEAEKEAEQ